MCLDIRKVKLNLTFQSVLVPLYNRNRKALQGTHHYLLSMLVDKPTQIITVTSCIFAYIFQYIQFLAAQLNALMNYRGEDPLLLLCNVVLFYVWLCFLGTHSNCDFLCYVLLIMGGGLLSFPLVFLCNVVPVYIFWVHTQTVVLCVMYY